jgi:flagellar biosynthesis/type III secretory pathway chaperone
MQLIDSLNQQQDVKIESVQELIAFIKALPIEQEEKHLYRFNAFLVDTINKIRKQTEMNQDFINRAMTSIDEVRNSLLGKTRFQTYTAQGKTRSMHRRT